MPPGRLIVMLVVLSTTLAVYRPACALVGSPGEKAERSSWAARLGTTVARGFPQISLMPRVTLRVPASWRASGVSDAAVPTPASPDPRLTCLPPPLA